ncbi:MAG: InlB B-repeat-containing protein, partial [Gaiellaceae bacterium]
DLSVSKDGTGSGAITSSPAGIDCGSNCKGTFDEGTVVTLTANPASDSTFMGWSGADCSGTGSCTVTVSDATSVTATFAKKATPAVVTAAPNTRIVKATINRAQRRASFKFTGSGKGKLSFQCSLDGKKFSSCRSGVVYKNLKKGAHTFRVRAKAGAKVDPTPAKKRFKI